LLLLSIFDIILTAMHPEIALLWDNYTSHLRKWFYNPDIEAAAITLAAAAAHFHKDSDPCWLFIIGPSSGDKTSICIQSISGLSQVHMHGDLTAKTFLSGYTGTAHPSLLHQIGSGIMSFKDFTTFLSKSPEEQAQIISQLREIYDGSFSKATGKGIPIRWEGKLTVIAAATLEFEKAWSIHRKMGERFVQVRIDRKKGIEQSQFAQRQRGFESFIHAETKKRAREFFQAIPPIINPPPLLSDTQVKRVAAMVEILAHCRTSVPRDPKTNTINDYPDIENSGRASKLVAGLIANHAALFRRAQITEFDMSIGARIVQNTIPRARYKILQLVPIQGIVGQDRLALASGLPLPTVDTIVEDLEHLGVLKVKHNTVVANEVSLTPEVQSLWLEAFPPSGYHQAPQLEQPVHGQQVN